MRLGALTNTLTSVRDPAAVISALQASGIRTSHDFLFSCTIQEIWKRLPPDTIIGAELQSLRHEILDMLACPGISGDVELEREEEIVLPPASTGIPDLDNICGGLDIGEVVEISGGRKAGKSVLALHIILQHLSQNAESTVVWIDTEYDFISERAFKILKKNGISNPTSVLDRLAISFENDAFGATTSVYQLRASLENQPQALRYIVIDNISSLFGPQLNLSSAKGHALLVTFMKELSSLARTFSLTAIVINDVVPISNALKPTLKPSLGETFTFMTDTSIWLSVEESRFSERKEVSQFLHSASILRSRKKASGTRCTFITRGDEIILPPPANQ